MGFLMTWGAYYVQIQGWSWSALAASIPVGLLVTAILNMNNVRDYREDLAAAPGIRRNAGFVDSLSYVDRYLPVRRQLASGFALLFLVLLTTVFGRGLANLA